MTRDMITPALLDAVANGLVKLDFHDHSNGEDDTDVGLTVEPIDRPDPESVMAPDVEVAVLRERLSVLSAECDRLRDENDRDDPLGSKLDRIERIVETRLAAPASWGLWVLAILVAADMFAAHHRAIEALGRAVLRLAV